MAEYVPPLEDIRFALEHVTDLRRLAGLPDEAVVKGHRDLHSGTGF